MRLEIDLFARSYRIEWFGRTELSSRILKAVISTDIVHYFDKHNDRYWQKKSANTSLCPL